MALVAIALGALLFTLHKTNKSLGETSEQIREAHRRQTPSNLRRNPRTLICGSRKFAATVDRKSGLKWLAALPPKLFGLLLRVAEIDF